MLVYTMSACAETRAYGRAWSHCTGKNMPTTRWIIHICGTVIQKYLKGKTPGGSHLYSVSNINFGRNFKGLPLRQLIVTDLLTSVRNQFNFHLGINISLCVNAIASPTCIIAAANPLSFSYKCADLGSVLSIYKFRPEEVQSEINKCTLVFVAAREFCIMQIGIGPSIPSWFASRAEEML